MENTGSSWGSYIFENSKILGNKILSGVKDATEYIAEKSKEGASYIAEKTKPATDKIKEGAGYIGSYAMDAIPWLLVSHTLLPASNKTWNTEFVPRPFSLFMFEHLKRRLFSASKSSICDMPLPVHIQ